MRICKPDEVSLIYGLGSPGGYGTFGSGSISASSGTPAGSVPANTSAPTFTVSANPSGPTYNGQPVTPVYGPIITATVTAPTFGITATTSPEVSYYDNGTMCIDPAAVNNGAHSGLGQTDTGLAGNADFGGIDTSNMA
jgi:hypothetical protein